MNKQRRKAIDEVRAKLEELLEDLEALKDEEEEALGNLPLSLQESERGQAMIEAVDSLEGAFDSVQEAIYNLEDAVQ